MWDKWWPGKTTFCHSFPLDYIDGLNIISFQFLRHVLISPFFLCVGIFSFKNLNDKEVGKLLSLLSQLENVVLVSSNPAKVTSWSLQAILLLTSDGQLFSFSDCYLLYNVEGLSTSQGMVVVRD